MQPNTKIIALLQRIQNRYNSIFFSKLVLLEDKNEQQEHYIRHYDVECEAATALMDTLNTKVKAITFRAFYTLKFFEKDRSNKAKNASESHSFVKNNSINSFYGLRSNHNISLRDGLNFPKTSRNRTMREDNTKVLSDLDFDISSLVKKFKHINDKFNRPSPNDPQDQQFNNKMSKRKLIMSKLNELQNDISQLSGENKNTGLQASGARKSWVSQRTLNKSINEQRFNQIY